MSSCSVTDEEPSEWLDISPDELDEKLTKSAAKAPPTQPSNIKNPPMNETGIRELTDEEDFETTAATDQQTAKLAELAQNVRRFVKGKADLEGARFEE